jgi:hypothetical protein
MSLFGGNNYEFLKSILNADNNILNVYLGDYSSNNFVNAVDFKQYNLTAANYIGYSFWLESNHPLRSGVSGTYNNGSTTAVVGTPVSPDEYSTDAGIRVTGLVRGAGQNNIILECYSSSMSVDFNYYKGGGNTGSSNHSLTRGINVIAVNEDIDYDRIDIQGGNQYGAPSYGFIGAIKVVENLYKLTLDTSNGSGNPYAWNNSSKWIAELGQVIYPQNDTGRSIQIIDQTDGTQNISFNTSQTVRQLTLNGGANTLIKFNSQTLQFNSSSAGSCKIICNVNAEINSNINLNNPLEVTVADGKTLTINSTVTGSTITAIGTGSGTKIITSGNSGSIPSLVVEDGVTFKGYGTHGTVTVKNGGKLHIGNSPGLQTIGTLVLESGSETKWELISHTTDTPDRGTQYDGIDVTGNATINSGALLNIILAGVVDVSNTWWDAGRVWNFIDTTGTLTGMFDTDDVFITYSGNPAFTNTSSSAGDFLVTNNGQDVTVNWTPIVVAGGDPHIKPIFGKKYMLENQENCYNLLNTLIGDKIVVNAKCWFLSNELLDEFRKINNDANMLYFMEKYTFFRYISIMCGNEKIIIDMETLDLVNYTNKDDVNNFNLQQISEKLEFNNIIVENIQESKMGLYSVPNKVYNKGGNTMSRKIIVKNDDCTVELIFSVNKGNEDRNSISLKINGKRKLKPSNYYGALISNCMCKVESLMFEF